MTEPLLLYDGLASSIKEFVPSDTEIKLYVCGVTPYDTAHLGHAFTYVSFDVLVRYLEYRGYRVRYVQNITDIDDPLFAKARDLNVPYDELAIAETDRYLSDMAALNVRPADVYPRASEEIPEMVRIAERLLHTDHAYLAGDRVYFSVASDHEYGELSKYDRPMMLATAAERGGDPGDANKRDPLDFLLWRPSQRDEPSFSSPWGPGLPGWHLECSAMSLKYLGAPLHIHGGGSDLLFPHHESEIAQSEAAAGVRPFSEFWMHTAMVYMNGEKMSKSLGNMVFVRDLVRVYGADAVRVYISGVHYRSQLDWNPDDMEKAATRARVLAAAISLPTVGGGSSEELDDFRKDFCDCLNSDLDTPGALAVLETLAQRMQSSFDTGSGIDHERQLLLELAGVLGLTLSSH